MQRAWSGRHRQCCCLNASRTRQPPQPKGRGTCVLRACARACKRVRMCLCQCIVCMHACLHTSRCMCRNAPCRAVAYIVIAYIVMALHVSHCAVLCRALLAMRHVPCIVCVAYIACVECETCMRSVHTLRRACTAEISSRRRCRRGRNRSPH